MAPRRLRFPYPERNPRHPWQGRSIHDVSFATPSSSSSRGDLGEDGRRRRYSRFSSAPTRSLQGDRHEMESLIGIRRNPQPPRERSARSSRSVHPIHLALFHSEKRFSGLRQNAGGYRGRHATGPCASARGGASASLSTGYPHGRFLMKKTSSLAAVVLLAAILARPPSGAPISAWYGRSWSVAPEPNGRRLWTGPRSGPRS